MRNLLCIAALFAAVSSAWLTAQVVPWTRLGLERLQSWGPASVLTVGDAEHGARGIALTFRGDAAVGVVLQKIAHRGTRKDGAVTWAEYASEPPLGQTKGLWHAVLRPATSDVPFELLPSMATSFEVWVDAAAGARDAIFAWDGLRLPGAADSRFWFELRVTVDPQRRERAVWLSRMGRVSLPGSLWAAPGSSAALVASLPADPVLTAIGIQWANPGAHLVADVGIVDPTGHRKLSFLFPSYPLGQPMMFQSLVVNQGGLQWSTPSVIVRN
jgi:hypothetical protein